MPKVNYANLNYFESNYVLTETFNSNFYLFDVLWQSEALDVKILLQDKIHRKTIFSLISVVLFPGQQTVNLCAQKLFYNSMSFDTVNVQMCINQFKLPHGANTFVFNF